MRTVEPLASVASSAALYGSNAVVNSRYTLYNFLPKNLYEQFSRPLNFYFLLVAMLQFISVIAPVSPLSTFLPLLLAFLLTAAKEGFDDVKRHRQDALYNAKLRTVLHPDTHVWVTKCNEEIVVGDVLLLHQDEDVPCDVVVLAASGQKAHTFIRTDNFDGEVDLKPRAVVQPRRPASYPLSVNDAGPDTARKLRAVELVYSAPNGALESFDGFAKFHGVGSPSTAANDSTVPLNHTHLLPQSTVLKSHGTVIAVAVYTGDDTKCGMNKHAAPIKWAKIDQTVSSFSILIFACQMVNAFGFGLFGFMMNRAAPREFWYLPEPRAERGAKAMFIYPLRFFLLTTVMIPVSFKCVVDMSKYYMALTVDWDESLSCAKTTNGQSEAVASSATARANATTRVRNSGILEDLGQIDCVLSDKTGTMTANEMKLLFVSVKPEARVDVQCFSRESEVPDPTRAELAQLACAMALCNTVDVTNATDVVGSSNSGSSSVSDLVADSHVRPLYDGASPDEVALCQGAATLGVTLVSRQDGRAQVRVASSQGVVTVQWIVHHVFPFSSEQKTMGVIVENVCSGEVHLFLKGADDRVRRALDSSEMANNAALERHLREYAGRGLRTLLVAERRLMPAELTTFLHAYKEAELDLHGRQTRLDALRWQMQQDMQLLGITAIEDRLQDRVTDTIDDLLRAGIKVWMLTGDKVETAEQIGLSCGLYHPDDEVIRVAETDPYAPGGANSAAWKTVLLSAACRLPSPCISHERADKQVWQMIGKDSVRNTRLFGCQSDFTRQSRVPVTTAGPHTSATTTIGGNSQRTLLVVQGGHILDEILRSRPLREAFGQAASRCVSVICARCTPSQKAAIARFVRHTGAMTLAIGDGGNDVAMLQEAHVGVGIVGKEGQQASRAADFSINCFSDLHGLIFVHGQQAYARTAYIIKYSFYKSMLVSFIQLAYNMAGTYYSGATYWNSFSLTMWNGFYTLPHTLLYCLDRCAPRVVLERNPALYQQTRCSLDMRPSEFFGVFVLKGVLQSIILLWLSNGLFGVHFADPRDGSASSHDVAFSVSYTALMVSQAVTVFLDSHAVTVYNVVALGGMPLFYLLSTQWFSNVRAVQYFGVFARTLHVEMWLVVLAEAAVLTLPFLVSECVRGALWPNPRDTLRRAEVRRQLHLLRYRVYRESKGLFVRLCRAVPEVSSVFSRSVDMAEAAALDASATHAV